MQRLVLTDSAKNDLDEIWFYIAAESGSIESAERVIWRLYAIRQQHNLGWRGFIPAASPTPSQSVQTTAPDVTDPNM